MAASSKAKSKSLKSHRSDQSTVIFTPPSSTYSNSSAQTDPAATPPSSAPSTHYPYHVDAYCRQPAALDGPIYGRLQNLPSNSSPGDQIRVAAYVGRAERIISSFDQSFYNGSRRSNK